jgi:hypothetical protein
MSEYVDDEGFLTEPSTRETSGPAVVSLGGRTWLLGMRWHSYETVLERQELLEEAESLHADWVARRSGDEVVQVGYCEAATKAWPSNIFSLAALLADSHKVPWAGAFDLGSGLWWYIAVRDNYGMMPDGDVVGSYEDIVLARQEHASIEDFNHVDGTREDLEKLIARSGGRRTKIESLTGSRFSITQILITGLVAFVACAGTGAYLYLKHNRENADNATKIAHARAQLRSQAVPDLVKMLQASPDPQVWLDACRASVVYVPLWQRGWHLKGLHCEGPSLIVNWERRNSATIAYAPPGVASEDGNSKTETLPLPLPAGLQGTVAALPLAEARDRMIEWGQLHNIVITFTRSNTPVPPPSTIAKLAGQTPPAPIQSLAVSFGVPAAPFALNFDGLLGLRLNALEPTAAANGAAVTGSSWQLTGVLYGR